jgi:hypothetical protein
MTKTNVLIDTVSIQNYIFSSNKLGINLGASHIVAHELYSMAGLKKYAQEDSLIYQGGGNAMLYFDTPTEAKEFIWQYSKSILTTYPGLRLAFGTSDGDIHDASGFQSLMENIHKNLRYNKNNYYTITTPFKPGIVADCKYSDEGASLQENGELRSEGVKSKLDQVEEGEKQLKAIFETSLGKYNFPRDFDELGQQEGKGYIAIVHIDGNGVGDMFSSTKNVAELKELSNNVKKIVTTILEKLLKIIIENLACFIEAGIEVSDNNLPFRPIIVGGDDITFVCEGRLGIVLAQKFLELYEEESINGKSLKACAGVTIVKTKYPFFKAYEIAETLLAKAKATSKVKDVNNYPSYIAYEIIGSGNTEPTYENVMSLSALSERIKIINEFNDEKTNKWSQSKIMQFRDVLSTFEETNDKAELDYFYAHAATRGIAKPTNAEKDMLEAIEMREFYIPLKN